MVITLPGGQQIRGDMIKSAVLRNDLAPVPVTLEAEIRLADDMERKLSQGEQIWAGGEWFRIIKAVRVTAKAAQGDHGIASMKIIALLDSCQAIAFVRERPISKERATLEEIYRAAGASIQAVDADFQVPRFACLVGDIPSYHVSRLLQAEGGVVRWKGGKLKFFRLADLFRQKPALDLPNNDAEDIDSGFTERHEVPWFYSLDENGEFVYGARGKARCARFAPHTDARQLRNMSRYLVRRKVTKMAYSGQLCAGDLVNFVGGEKLSIITAAHAFESGTDDGGVSNTYTKLWLGALAGG